MIVDFIIYHTPIFYLIQSLWRDEAFSYFMAGPNILRVIINTINDFNPPLYYILLHYFILLFGKWDEMLRILSFIPHLLTVYIAYIFARKLFSKKYALFVALFTFFNPMLLYYAFEMRMYSLYAFFAISSLYFFNNKNWKWYTIVSILGLYTHSFFPLTILSFILYLFFTSKLTKKVFFNTLLPILFYIPWIPILIIQFIHSKDSWMFPVDRQLVMSVLGNIFTNYEGTPGNWWPYTAILSGILILFIGLSFCLNRNNLSKIKTALLFTIPIFFPLMLILVFSVTRRPIYVNRYLIFITIYEIMAVSFSIASIKNSFIRSFLSALWIIFIILFNISITPYHKKIDFKTAFKEINIKAKKTDSVYSKTPIGFLESAYYYKYPNNTFVYNPYNIRIPNYIGVNLVFPNASKATFPRFPAKTFLIDDNASYEIIIYQ